MKSHHVEYYWEDICQQQVKDIYDHYYEWYTNYHKLDEIYPIEQMTAMLDFIINETDGLSKPLTKDVVYKIDSNPIFFDIAAYSIFTIDRLDWPINVDWHLISGILINKQKDYGTENIMKFGLVGIVVRLFDKIARLNNLLIKGHGDLKQAMALNSVNGESLLDTLIDIVGYCTIALMIIEEDTIYKNKFLVPMASRNND